MMFLVEKTFKDKDTKRIHEKGNLYITEDKDRIENLRELGFIGIELVKKDTVESLVGGNKEDNEDVIEKADETKKETKKKSDN